MERTSSWLNEESTGNRYFERSSAGPRSRPSPRRYARQKRPGRLLRVLLLERRIRRRYSIWKKSSCSSNFWNGGAARKTCRNEPTPTPVLFAKAFDIRQSLRQDSVGGFWLFSRAPSSTRTRRFHASPFFDSPQARSKLS